MLIIAQIRDRCQETGEPAVCEEPDPWELDSEDAGAWDRDSCWDLYLDDISGKVLDPQLVGAARQSELDYIREMKVWEVVPRPSDLKVLRGRWVDVNKGDEGNPNYRSRYVAKEIKKGARSSLVAEYFAAMPPIQGCKFLLILAVTQQWHDLEGNLLYQEEQLVIGFLDVKRAHFVAMSRRLIHVELPDELRAIHGQNMVGRLIKSLYGTRDASSNWEYAIRDILVDKLQFVQGSSSPCHYYHKERQIRVTVHGDDFTSLGTLRQVQWFHESLSSEWKVEVRGILGPPGMPHTVHEIRHLNRLISWDSEGITWEPDPRHVDILCQNIGPTGSKVTVPLVKEKLGELDTEEELMPESSARMYRSHTMRNAIHLAGSH